MALFVVLSVFSGLKDLSLSFTNQADPDLKILPLKGKSLIFDKKFKSIVEKNDVVDYTTIIEEKALFRYKGKDIVVELKGVSSNFLDINDYESSIQLGQWFSEKSSGTVVGSGVAQKLSLALNDQENPLEVIVPKAGQINQMRVDQAFMSEYLIGVGVFFNTEEANAKYAFVDIDLAKELLGYKTNEVSSVALKIERGKDANKVKKNLLKAFENNMIVKTRSELNASLHKMLNTENLVLYVIFVLIILMVMFTLFGSLLMMIIEKRINIKTLHDLGMRLSDIKLIFLFQGAFVSIFGAITGVLFGIIIVFLQEKYEIVMINESLAYPVVFNWVNLFIVILTVFSIGAFMSWLASNTISKKFLIQ